MKKLAIIYQEHKTTIDAISANIKNAEVETFKTLPDNYKNFDLIAGVGVSDDIFKDIEAVNVHHSLLPAFEEEEPVKQAILYGAKVTGISFYYTKSKKIITQYPIFISNSSHFDEVEQEIKYLEQTLYPLVLDKLINNELFEAKDILAAKKCSGNCGGCSGCSH